MHFSTRFPTYEVLKSYIFFFRRVYPPPCDLYYLSLEQTKVFFSPKFFSFSCFPPILCFFTVFELLRLTLVIPFEASPGIPRGFRSRPLSHLIAPSPSLAKSVFTHLPPPPPLFLTTDRVPQNLRPLVSVRFESHKPSVPFLPPKEIFPSPNCYEDQPDLMWFLRKPLNRLPLARPDHHKRTR